MTTTEHTAAERSADEALKTKHRKMWATGDYPELAARVIPQIGARLVEALPIGPGVRVLDVAAGTGNAAIPAARAGASVVASDLTPELLEAGAASVAGADLDLTWETGDAEALPYADDSFDVVMSAIGAMFAPHHQVVADELVRVTRPGGTLGLLSWTPEGHIGQLFATMKPYAPPPPPGAQPPPLWGSEAHVTELFGDRLDDVQLTRAHYPVDCFASGAEFRDFFKATYGPTIAIYRNIAEDPQAVADLDAAIAALPAAQPVDGVMRWEYLLMTARVR